MSMSEKKARESFALKNIQSWEEVKKTTTIRIEEESIEVIKVVKM